MQNSCRDGNICEGNFDGTTFLQWAYFNMNIYVLDMNYMNIFLRKLNFELYLVTQISGTIILSGIMILMCKKACYNVMSDIKEAIHLCYDIV